MKCSSLKLLLVVCLMTCLPIFSFAQIDTALFNAGLEQFEAKKLNEAEHSLIIFLGNEARDTVSRSPEMRLESYFILAEIQKKRHNFSGAKKWLRCANNFASKDALLAKEYVPRIKHSFEVLNATEIEYIHSRKILLVLCICLSSLLVIILAVFIAQYVRLRKSFTKLAEQAKAWALDASESAQKDEKAEENPLLTQIRVLFERDHIYLNNDLTLENLSETLHTNRTYVSSAIRTVSPNFNRFVSDYRIKEAIRILDGGWTKTIEELAIRCGYSSARTFSNAFKDITGLTPGAFRHNC